jgi:hypothetical protein
LDGIATLDDDAGGDFLVIIVSKISGAHSACSAVKQAGEWKVTQDTSSTWHKGAHMKGQSEASPLWRNAPIINNCL